MSSTPRASVKLASLAALSVASALTGAAFASPELRVEGRHFKDASGRVVVLRGVNVAGNSKVPPFRPATDPAIFDPLAAWGLNVVRLLFTWEAYEPSPGAYDQSYLDYYTAAARAAWDRGLFVIVDFHQDAFSRSSLGGCGDGFPAWAIPPSIPPAAPDNGPSCADWGPRMLKDKEMAASWDAFYADDFGARTRYIEMLKSVASHLDAEPGVIGYDIVNEPWGSEAAQIGPFYQDAAAALRGASKTAILFVEPRALASAGNPTELADPKIEGSAYAPHFYDASVLLFKSWSNIPPDKPWGFMLGTAEAWGVPLLIGELGAPAGTASVDGYLDALYSRLDESFASATQWVYTPGWTVASKDGWNDEDLSIVDDQGRLRDNFRVRPYARRVAGEPTSAHITRSDDIGANQIDLRWENEPSAGETEIFAPIDSLFGGRGALIEATGDGLACSLGGSLVTCSSAEAGPMKVVVRARPAPAPSTEGASCGLTGLEMLLLLPLYGAARRARRDRDQRGGQGTPSL